MAKDKTGLAICLKCETKLQFLHKTGICKRCRLHECPSCGIKFTGIHEKCSLCLNKLKRADLKVNDVLGETGRRLGSREREGEYDGNWHG